MMTITSHNNSIIKQARKLTQDGKARRQAGLFVVEGLRLCRDAAQNGGVVRTAFMTPAFAEDRPDDAQAFLRLAAQTYTVSPSVMAKLSDTPSPQGVLCLCQTPAFGVLPAAAGRFVVLENVSDPANLGAVARTAEALGLDGLLVTGGCDAYHPKALRASMGALLRLPVYTADAGEALACLKQLGVTTYAALVRDADRAVTRADFSGPCAVVVGNEANGLTSATAAACDGSVTIPMAGRAESLNVAAAACILIWEMTGRGGDL